MMLCCPNCGSRFFKTLELRFEIFKKQVQALLYKKRCKRCKEKYLIELTADNKKAKYEFATPERWQSAQRVHQNSSHTVAHANPYLCVSTYTRLISSDTSKIYDKLLNRP